ncbi:MAG: hypothetical protein DLM73_09895 [Chthoniobacterales bacterium]|nr:MAG: hypothetical protein DLM73_09895 [Chthoniobacterales bacterium]
MGTTGEIRFVVGGNPQDYFLVLAPKSVSSRQVSGKDFQISRNAVYTFHFPPSTFHFLLSNLPVPSVVFLRAVNVGGANLCRPAAIAKELSKFGLVNIGAVGTFVVREVVSESVLRAAIARKLPFKCEIMICPARDIIKLAAKDPFSREPSGPNITRFVNVLHKPLRTLPPIPLSLPSEDDWLLKVIAIQDRFVLGLYRREMKAISYLGKIEKLLGVPVTTRNWNTIEKVVKILGQDLQD